MDVFRALLHDSPAPGPAPDVAAHRALLDRPEAWAVGPLVVGDERLAGLDGDVALSVVTSGGAGGVAALARRADGLRLVAVETVLRDLDDLAGNAARVVTAAGELPDGALVLVGLPAGAGLVDAVEVVEAAGLQGRLDLSAHRGAAEQMSVLVEADLGFKVTGLNAETFGPYGVVAVLMAVEALVDGAEAEDAEQLLVEPDEARSRLALAAWDEALQGRVRRRLLGVDCDDVASTLDRLGGAGLL
ncbi:MAG: hypothetical protein ACRYG2_05665 [Janthinobacterium lividum]